MSAKTQLGTVLVAWAIMFVLAIELRAPVFLRLLPLTSVVVLLYLIYFTIRAVRAGRSDTDATQANSTEAADAQEPSRSSAGNGNPAKPGKSTPKPGGSQNVQRRWSETDF